MRPAVLKVASQIDDVCKQFQKALMIGERIRTCDDEAEITRLTDERWRVCAITEHSMGAINTQLTVIANDLAHTPSEQAFLREKRAMLSDLAPKFVAQDRELQRALGRKLEMARKESVQLQRNTQAIKQYIQAPSKPWN
jgi:hypothetical protein